MRFSQGPRTQRRDCNAERRELRSAKSTSDFVKELFGSDEFEADGRRYGDVFSSWSELAGIRVDVEGDNCVAELILDKKEIAGGVEREVTRLFSAGRHATHRGKRPFFHVDADDGDAVHAAIGDVQKPSAGMDRNLGDIIAAGKIRRQRGDAVDLFQVALLRIERKAGCGRIELADDKEKFPVRRENGVARAGPG